MKNKKVCIFEKCKILVRLKNIDTSRKNITNANFISLMFESIDKYTLNYIYEICIENWFVDIKMWNKDKSNNLYENIIFNIILLNIFCI